MKQRLSGRRVAILAAKEDSNRALNDIRQALEAAGATVEVVLPNANRVMGASASEYAALVILDGDALRRDQRSLQLAREMMLLDKPVAAIGGGALLLAEAGALTGRAVASSPELRADIEKAGAEAVDRAVHVDANLITARAAADLSPFEDRLIQELAARAEQWKVDELSESSFPASDPPPGPTALGGEGASRSSTDRDAGARH
jgi:protease I